MGLLVREVVHAVIAEVAPEELPLVAGLSQLDDATVIRRLRRSGSRREQLGFGLDDMLVLITPVVWLVLDQIAQKIAGGAVNGSTRRLKVLFRKVVRQKTAQVAVPPLAREQLAQVRRQVMEAALRVCLEEKRAAAVADMVVTQLVLADAGPQASDEPG
ncbi:MULTISPECIES: hypothetical protein [unclassified Micromonospora]|uniref:hypothetical protein n=1 Tax=unclassified Micromonospora TaxID=2617518 RepID=UPI00098D228A|nr:MULTISPECIES: hypothetical protein [unclassified Micromonospora]MDI5938311.1 hypothetical protein [Micromonospora sp. DH15]OON32452.1 hypothetical protein BSA16_05400 [Micromonospora sp. Rc5]